MPETLTDAQKVIRNSTGLAGVAQLERTAAALETLASGVEPSTVIAPDYNPAQTYAVGALVMYKGSLYRCTTAIPTPEAWTPGHWAVVTVADELADKYEKPSSGIPKTDLASGVQTSLGKADTALQFVPSTYRTASAQDAIDNGKQAKIDVTGLLKGNGNGSVSAATAGTDYETPAGAKALGLTGAAVGDLVRVKTVDANGKPTSWSHVPLCDIVTNPNLLDNWYFVYGKTIDESHPYSADNSFPINQRGQSAYPSAGYGIDRWKTLSAGAVTLYSDGLSISNANGAQFRQIIDHPEQLAGKTVTISMLGDSAYAAIELRNNAGLIKNKLLDSTGFAYITFVVPDNTTGLYCSIYTRSTSANKIKAVKLELGAEQTLAHWDGTAWVLNEIPDYSKELTKCMYYYQRFSGTVSLGYGSMQTARRASIPVMFPTIIKTPYTFTQSGNAGITYSGGNPIPTVTMNAGSSALAEMYAELPSGATDGSKGECVNLWLRSGASLEFSAEL
jgi:hypothetical protein